MFDKRKLIRTLELDQIRSDWIRLDQIRSDWVRLDQIGPDWIILDHIGTDSTRLERIGWKKLHIRTDTVYQLFESQLDRPNESK